MITVLTGENDFAVKGAVAKIVSSFDGVAEKVDGVGLELKQLPDLLMGTTLFADKRLVVVDGLSKNKAIWEVLDEWLGRVSDDVHLVLVESTPDKRTRTYKWLQKNAQVSESQMLSEPELVKWLQASAQGMGLSLDPKTARFLIDFVGTDQWRLRQDLEKLHLSGQTLTPELIRDIIEPNPQASVFQLLDAVFAGNSSEVERHLQILRGSEEPYRFFGLLANQIYALLLCANAEGRDAQAIAKDAGLHPFVIRKLQPLARKLSRTQQQKIVDTLADLDRQLKSTGSDPWTLIQFGLSNIR